MLLLVDTANSLKKAIVVITNFGVYLGLVINWTKSSLILIANVARCKM